MDWCLTHTLDWSPILLGEREIERWLRHYVCAYVICIQSRTFVCARNHQCVSMCQRASERDWKTLQNKQIRQSIYPCDWPLTGKDSNLLTVADNQPSLRWFDPRQGLLCALQIWVPLSLTSVIMQELTGLVRTSNHAHHTRTAEQMRVIYAFILTILQTTSLSRRPFLQLCIWCAALSWEM